MTKRSTRKVVVVIDVREVLGGRRVGRVTIREQLDGNIAIKSDFIPPF
jgi:hypothetical protein